MPVTITIRDVDDSTRDALAARAAASGRSLQEFLSFELREIASRPELPEVLHVIRARARSYPEAVGLLDDVAADRR